MIMSILEGIDVLDLAVALVAAGGTKKVKLLLKVAEREASSDGVKDLLRLVRMKVTHLEDQSDGESL